VYVELEILSIQEGQVVLVQRLLERVVFFSSNSNLRSENMELLYNCFFILILM